MDFSTRLGPCTDNLEPFPRPDRVEITIIRDGCESIVVIDINDETVFDPTAPDNVLEFRNPILVPPCEADGSTAP